MDKVVKSFNTQFGFMSFCIKSKIEFLMLLKCKHRVNRGGEDGCPLDRRISNLPDRTFQKTLFY